MNSARRGTGVLLALAATCTLAVASAPSASAATWKLEGAGQELCTRPGDSDNTHLTYFLAAISGDWSTPINLELRNLPPGSINVGGRAYPADRIDGNEKYTAFVGLRLGRAPAGVYNVKIVASDGKETQSIPVRIVSKEDC